MTPQTFSAEMPGLAADGPDPELGAAAELFAPLIGDWRMRTTLMPLGEPESSLEGFWSFRWGLSLSSAIRKQRATSPNCV